MVSMTRRLPGLLAVAALVLLQTAQALAQPAPVGIVIMHGKGGAPGGLVAGLASELEGKGYAVVNLEMPWSGRRNYDVPVTRAEEEVDAALARLRGQGAKKVFVAGHSQGGVFALHLAGRLAVDGVISIAPGGSVSSKVFRSQLGDSLARARQLIADGKGDERARLEDYEGSKGRYPVAAVPSAYVTWFDPDGAMNVMRAARTARPGVPILWIVPTRDYPGLLRTSPGIFQMLPSNPLSRFYQPDADHRGAPSAAADEIVRWTREVAGTP